ncbi:heavy-metal-associated domain-containing protein [Aquabacterium sp. A7-Y]|uniref:heavy-metal-associated domain-containing protein n=1 Tax=Aquabacterium sp. A7-Y TaxID=1349605 RepID=UPI00223E50DA|nr:heavy-metal-associated domain-containing protein [Aquabacterium sp. A7-Y]MCW7541435.1 heavy-metal-associated domain-containing protein [Aquabacterium sp. A7-Y]
MIAFEVNDMTCGHCVSTITKAVKQTDRDAVVAVDLGSKRVQIEAKAADEAELKAAIEEAGYTPVSATAVAKAARPSGGSCCGSCH